MVLVLGRPFAEATKEAVASLAGKVSAKRLNGRANGTVAVLLCVLLLNDVASAGDRPREPSARDVSCPEAEVAELCIHAMTSIEAVREWAVERGWHWEAHSGDLYKSGFAFRENIVGIHVTEARFSDVVHLRCLAGGFGPSSSNDPPTCPNGFPYLTEFLGEPNKHANGVKFDWVAVEGKQQSKWHVSNKGEELWIQAAADTDGRHPIFVVTRLRIQDGR